MKSIQTDNRGFTLVELAIVITIIGLLIGGTIKGQQVVENARVTSTVTKIGNIRTAVSVFQSTYDGLPGDLDTAQTRVRGCAVAANNCANGSGDYFVDGPGAAGAAIAWDAAIAAAAGSEALMFWKHMALAGILDGVDPSANPAAAAPAWGASAPAAPLRNAGIVAYSDDDWGDMGPSRPGLALRLQRGTSDVAATTGLNDGPVSPKQAAQMDRKLDDGRASTGDVFAGAGAAGIAAAGCKSAAGAADYNEANDSRSCAMFFLLDS